MSWLAHEAWLDYQESWNVVRKSQVKVNSLINVAEAIEKRLKYKAKQHAATKERAL